MQHSKSPIISQVFVDSLFTCSYFIDKFQQLQLQTNRDLIHVQTIIQNGQKNINNNDETVKQQNNKIQKIDNNKTFQNDNKKSSNSKNNKIIGVQEIIGDISQLIIQTFKQTVYKQTNTFYENKLNIMNIMQEIQNIKQNINKMNQAGSFVGISKTMATQQSLTPQKQIAKGKYKYNKIVDTSMFLDNDDQSSIQCGIKGRNLAQDRLSSFSFMNSFLNQNKINAHDQQIINQRINASISKVQSSIQDRICQVQKEFTRRIQQVMKTIKNLIQAMNQNDGLAHQSPFGKVHKYKTQADQPVIVQPALKKVKQSPKIISSKSTITLSNMNKQTQQSPKIDKKAQNLNNVQVNLNKKSQNSANSANSNKSDLQQQSLLNRSSKTLTSFFRLGKTVAPSK